MARHDKRRLARDTNLETIVHGIYNVTDAMQIIDVVENTPFDILPELWVCCGDYDTGSVVRVGTGADYLCYNIHI